MQGSESKGNYYGSEECTDEEIDIHNSASSMGIVDQDWYDRRLKATFHELLSELLYVIGLHHMKQSANKIIKEHYNEEN